MSVKVEVKLSGFKELDASMESMRRATMKRVLVSSLTRAVKPMVDRMKALVPKRSRLLHNSIIVSPNLSKRQKAVHKRFLADPMYSIELFVGPGARVNAITQEFGTYFHPAQPFVRPAFEQEWEPTIERFKTELEKAIAKSLANSKKRAASK